ncbi:MAG: hypothetical protein IBJ11_07140 [Phycisphaerales bacterium]|nr:hypothetical protein [Phycisphaerales bacterium]
MRLSKLAAWFVGAAAAVWVGAGAAWAQERGAEHGRAAPADARGEVELRILDVRSIRPAFQGMDMIQALTNLGAVTELQEVRPVGDGIYAIVGDAKSIASFTDALSKVRQSMEGPPMPSTERVDVEVAVYAVPSDGEVRLGAAFTPAGAPVHRSRQSLAFGGGAEVEAMRTLAYVKGWTPIVGQQAVGYQSDVGVARDGLKARLRLGGDGAARTVMLDAEVSSVTFEQVAGPTVDKTPLLSQLPIEQRRTLRSEVALAPGVLTAAGVAQGFKPGEQLVLAVRVTPTPK